MKLVTWLSSRLVYTRNEWYIAWLPHKIATSPSYKWTELINENIKYMQKFSCICRTFLWRHTDVYVACVTSYNIARLQVGNNESVPSACNFIACGACDVIVCRACDVIACRAYDVIMPTLNARNLCYIRKRK